jgi:hydroxyacylglutathione hydrolase
MILEILSVGPLQSNCYILGCDATRSAVVIDPGGEIPRILGKLAQLELNPELIFCTHAHYDHICGLAELKQLTGAKALLHAEDFPLYDNLAVQAAWIGLPAPQQTEIDQKLTGNEVLQFGDLSGQILHTPGHSPGSCCFLMTGSVPRLFSGDTLFRESIGRTDLWGGSYESLLNSLMQKILPLPDDMIISPGHGPESTLRHEKKNNPFLRSQSLRDS